MLFKGINYLKFWQTRTVVQEISFKDISYQQSATICAILVEGIKRNISVKLFLICASGSGRDFF